MCVVISVFKFRKLLAKALLDEGRRSLGAKSLEGNHQLEGRLLRPPTKIKLQLGVGYRRERGHLAGKIGL